MIKTYVYNRPMNNVSHILVGQGGNSVRFNFTHGNTIVKKLPELTLRGKYYQDLLESSTLYTSGLVRCTRKIEEDSDKEDAAEQEEEATTTEQEVQEVASVKTADELIAYVNETYGKEFRNVANALKYAAKMSISFPNYNPD